MNSGLVMYEEEFRLIAGICDRLTRDANAKVVFLVDKNGQLIASSGQAQNLDTTSLASLTAGNVAATGGIAVFYLVTFLLSLFGVRLSIFYGSGPVSIVISLVIVVIAALNLVLDFDFIEQGAAQGAPKYMEWYAAFGLMVTLIWLYLEILRLLMKLRSRD